MNKRGSITYIEILVIISIIVLLIGILLPAFGVARKIAETENKKQIMLERNPNAISELDESKHIVSLYKDKENNQEYLVFENIYYNTLSVVPRIKKNDK